MQGGFILASHPAALGFILGIPNNFSKCCRELVDCIAYNSGQRLDNVNQARLVLTSVKLVRQKTQKMHLPF